MAVCVCCLTQLACFNFNTCGHTPFCGACYERYQGRVCPICRSFGGAVTHVGTVADVFDVSRIVKEPTVLEVLQGVFFY